MQMKLILIGLLAMTTMIATAQASEGGGQTDEALHRGRSAHGHGVAVNRQGHAVEFRFGVAKHGDRQAGSLRVSNAGDSDRPFVIELAELQRIGFGRNTAEFTGTAVLVVRTPNGPERVRGIVHVSVVDNASDRRHSDRTDLFSIQFQARERDLNYEFRGAVRRGDIVVR